MANNAAVRLAVSLLVLLGCSIHAQDARPPAPRTFTNPILESGADPWVLTGGGFYYYMNTTGRNLTLWRTRDITDLRHAEKKVIWTPELGHLWSKQLWAPEIHRWGSKWYVYFAASDGCGIHRSPRIQPFTWNTDGMPIGRSPCRPSRPRTQTLRNPRPALLKLQQPGIAGD